MHIAAEASHFPAFHKAVSNSMTSAFLNDPSAWFSGWLFRGNIGNIKLLWEYKSYTARQMEVCLVQKYKIYDSFLSLGFHCKEWVSASCVILICLSSSFICPCSFLFASCGLYLVSIKGMFSLRLSFFLPLPKPQVMHHYLDFCS